MSDFKKETITISGSRERDILMDIRFREDFVPKPIIIFAHGYKGYKDWGAWNIVADKFAASGYIFVKFNFSYNGGTPEDPIDFPDLKAFGQNTYSTEVDDLNLVIDWASSHDWQGQGDGSRIGLIGHSRGGGITLIAAVESDKVKAVTTWAAVSDFGKRFPNGDELEEWRNKGVRYVKNGRTGQDMPHEFEFYRDYQDNADRLSIENAVRSLDKGFFIVHGENDEAVDVSEADSLFKWSDTALMEIIEESGHTFGAKQPWESKELPKPLSIATLDTIAFFRDMV